MLEKVKNNLAPAMVVTFVLLKVVLGLVELPHYTKESTVLPWLALGLILIVLAIGIKIYQQKIMFLRKGLKTQLEALLLWVVTVVFIIFTWSLCDALGWNIGEKVLIVVCEVLETFLIVLLTEPTFISKMEFYGFAGALSVNVIALSLKTVGFIQDDSHPAHKDIVLLNLSTQIALAIILLDALQRSYEKHAKIHRE
jgi:hypothetical protein